MSTAFERGPRVTRTASTSWVAPRKTFSRATFPNRTCLAGIFFALYPHGSANRFVSDTLDGAALARDRRQLAFWAFAHHRAPAQSGLFRADPKLPIVSSAFAFIDAL